MSAGQRWSRGAAIGLLVSWCLALAAFDLRYHEFWRDEANALLEAHAVPWGGLIEALRIEGVPPLYHALLKIAASVLPKTLALVAVGALGTAALLAGTYRLVASVSGSKARALGLTVVLAPTYTYAYELGVIIRQYALGLGLSLLAASFLRDALETKRRRDVVLGTVLGSLAALTAAHAACVAGAVFLAFGLSSLRERGGIRRALPVFASLPCLALAVWMAQPNPERTPDANVDYAKPALEWLSLGAQAFSNGVAPVDFWSAELYSPVIRKPPFVLLRTMVLPATLAALVVVLALVLRGATVSRRRAFLFDGIAAFAGAAPLTEIFADHYFGGHRHHVFMVMPVLLFAAGHTLAPQDEARWAGRWGPRLFIGFFGPWLAFQYVLSASSFLLDRTYPFSDTKAAAAVLPTNARVVAEDDWRVLGVLMYRDDVVMWAAQGNGRRLEYLRPDAIWHDEVDVEPMVLTACEKAEGPVVLETARARPPAYRNCMTRLPFPMNPLRNQPRTWESFYFFSVDCACVSKNP